MTSHQEIVANSNQGYGNNDDNDDDDISNTITINNSSIVYWIQFDAHTLSLETLFRKLNFIFPHVSDVGLHQNKFNSERNNSNGSGDENDVNDNNNSSSNNNDTLGVGHCKHRYRFNPIHTLYVSENPNCESQVIPLPEVGEGLCVEIQNKTQYQVASPSTRLLLTESNEERKNNFQTHSVVGQKGKGIVKKRRIKSNHMQSLPPLQQQTRSQSTKQTNAVLRVEGKTYVARPSLVYSLEHLRMRWRIFRLVQYTIRNMNTIGSSGNSSDKIGDTNNTIIATTLPPTPPPTEIADDNNNNGSINDNTTMCMNKEYSKYKQEKQRRQHSQPQQQQQLLKQKNRITKGNTSKYHTINTTTTTTTTAKCLDGEDATPCHKTVGSLLIESNFASCDTLALSCSDTPHHNIAHMLYRYNDAHEARLFLLDDGMLVGMFNFAYSFQIVVLYPEYKVLFEQSDCNGYTNQVYKFHNIVIVNLVYEEGAILHNKSAYFILPGFELIFQDYNKALSCLCHPTWIVFDESGSLFYYNAEARKRVVHCHDHSQRQRKQSLKTKGKTTPNSNGGDDNSDESDGDSNDGNDGNDGGENNNHRMIFYRWTWIEHVYHVAHLFPTTDTAKSPTLEDIFSFMKNDKSMLVCDRTHCSHQRDRDADVADVSDSSMFIQNHSCAIEIDIDASRIIFRHYPFNTNTNTNTICNCNYDKQWG